MSDKPCSTDRPCAASWGRYTCRRPLVPGMRLCAHHREYNLRYKAMRYAERKARGVCPRCGGRPKGGCVGCARCIASECAGQLRRKVQMVAKTTPP